MDGPALYQKLVSGHNARYTTKMGAVSRVERLGHVEKFYDALKDETLPHAKTESPKSFEQAHDDLTALGKLLVPAAKPVAGQLVIRMESSNASRTLLEIGLRNFAALKNDARKKGGNKAKALLAKLAAGESRWKEFLGPKIGLTAVFMRAPELAKLQQDVFAIRIAPFLPKANAAAVKHAIDTFRKEEPEVHEEMRKLREEGSN